MAAMLLTGCGVGTVGDAKASPARIVQIPAPTPGAADATATPAATEMPSPSASPTTIGLLPTQTPRPAPGLNGTVIRVYKGERQLELWMDGVLEHLCGIGLGFAPEGHKEREGDGRTPEGEYYVCTRNEQSRYYLSLGLSYPNAADAAAGLAEGRITQAEHDAIVEAIQGGRRPSWNTPLGGEIMIHGMGGSADWTLGCIAVDDGDMDILWEHAAIGTTVLIYL